MQTTTISREAAETEFVERMRADLSAGWIRLDPPPSDAAVEKGIAKGHFERRGEGRCAEYRWTVEGNLAHGMTEGSALDRLLPGSTGPAVAIWRFHEAPAELQDLSTSGGDEDWLAVVPSGMEVPSFLTDNPRFGICDTHEIVLRTGETVLIGSHS